MNETWSSDPIASPAAVPVVVGDRVVAADDDGGLVGLDAASGDEVWRWQAPRDIEPVIAAAGGAVVATIPDQDDPRLCAVDAADGVERWCRTVDVRALGMAGLARPLLAGTDDAVVTFALDGVVRAFDAALGEDLWEVVVEETDDLIRHPALFVAGDVALVGTHAVTDEGPGAVVAVDVADGSVRWRVSFDASLGSHTFTLAGTGVIVHAAARLASLDLRTGEPRWDVVLTDPPVGSYSMVAADPVVIDDLVLALPRAMAGLPGEGVVLVGLDAGSGEERWSQVDPPLVAEFARAGHYAALGAIDGAPVLVGEDVSELDPATGEVTRTTALGLRAGQPFVHTGEGLVVVDDEGRVRHLGP